MTRRMKNNACPLPSIFHFQLNQNMSFSHINICMTGKSAKIKPSPNPITPYLLVTPTSTVSDCWNMIYVEIAIKITETRNSGANSKNKEEAYESLVRKRSLNKCLLNCHIVQALYLPNYQMDLV